MNSCPTGTPARWSYGTKVSKISLQKFNSFTKSYNFAALFVPYDDGREVVVQDNDVCRVLCRTGQGPAKLYDFVEELNFSKDFLLRQ